MSKARIHQMRTIPSWRSLKFVELQRLQPALIASFWVLDEGRNRIGDNKMVFQPPLVSWISSWSLVWRTVSEKTPRVRRKQCCWSFYQSLNLHSCYHRRLHRGRLQREQGDSSGHWGEKRWKQKLTKDHKDNSQGQLEHLEAGSSENSDSDSQQTTRGQVRI